MAPQSTTSYVFLLSKWANTGSKMPASPKSIRGFKRSNDIGARRRCVSEQLLHFAWLLR